MPRSALALVLALAPTLACSPPVPPGPNPPEPTPTDGQSVALDAERQQELLEQVAPRLCVGEEMIAEIVGSYTLPGNGVFAAESAQLPKGTKGTGPAKAYRKAAPATVLINPPGGGFGSGVVVDPRGYIVTNFHVVDAGTDDSLELHVKVRIGDPRKDGSIKMREASYDGVVVKADPLRDLALVKLDNPPDELAFAKIAKDDVSVGDPLAAIGSGHVGGLFALKTCNVSNILGFADGLAAVAANSCEMAVAGMEEADRDAVKQKCEQAIEDAKKQAKSMNPGKMIQTSCDITGGDSGGPVVNMKGELVGLNQLGNGSGTAAFHIHRDELIDFLREIPEQAAQHVPDPYCDFPFSEYGLASYLGTMTGRPADAVLADVDLDGEPDALRVGVLSTSLMLDLDQDSFTGDPPPRGFDAELVVHFSHDDHEIEAALQQGQPIPMPSTYVWYDRDGDGEHDRLLTGTGGQVERAFERKDSRWVPDDKAAKGAFIDPSLFDALPSDGAKRLQLAADELLGGTSETQRSGIPGDPMLATSVLGESFDADGDGTRESAHLVGLVGGGLLVDVDQDSGDALSNPEIPRSVLIDRAIDAELSLVFDGSVVYAFWDTDDQPGFDLVLGGYAEGPEVMAVAAHRRQGEQWVDAPAEVGRNLFRTALVGGGTPGQRVVASVESRGVRVSRDDGLGSFPNPRPADAYWDWTESWMTDSGRALVGVTGTATHILIDADGSSGFTNERDPSETARDANFRPDLVIVEGKDLTWFYYDGDGDGAFDRVAVATPWGSLIRGFTVVSGKAVVDNTLANGPTVSFDVFTPTQRGQAVRDVVADLTSAAAEW